MTALQREVRLTLLARAGFSPAFQVETHDYATAIAFVDAGVGLTVLPRLAARNPPAGVAVVPVTRPTPQRTLYAVVQTAVAGEPSVQAAMSLLWQCAGTDRDTVTAGMGGPVSDHDAARPQQGPTAGVGPAQPADRVPRSARRE